MLPKTKYLKQISQYYDGVVVMDGKLFGVQSRIKEILFHDIYLYYFTH
jgi:hypothetical protein